MTTHEICEAIIAVSQAIESTKNHAPEIFRPCKLTMLDLIKLLNERIVGDNKHTVSISGKDLKEMLTNHGKASKVPDTFFYKMADAIKEPPYEAGNPGG